MKEKAEMDNKIGTKLGMNFGIGKSACTQLGPKLCSKYGNAGNVGQNVAKDTRNRSRNPGSMLMNVMFTILVTEIDHRYGRNFGKLGHHCADTDGKCDEDGDYADGRAYDERRRREDRPWRGDPVVGAKGAYSGKWYDYLRRRLRRARLLHAGSPSSDAQPCSTGAGGGKAREGSREGRRGFPQG